MANQKSVHDDYEIPDELDFSKLEVVGLGLDSLKDYDRRKAAQQTRMAELAPDVAAAFTTNDEVNEALRTILRAAKHLNSAIEKKTA